MSKRRDAARRPAPRTVRVELTEGEYQGSYAVVRADFPARVLMDLESRNVGRIMDGLDAIVLEHNLPDSSGEVAAAMADVDPYQLAVTIAREAFAAIGALPPR